MSAAASGRASGLVSQTIASNRLLGIATENPRSQQAAPDWKEWDAGHLRMYRMWSEPDIMDGSRSARYPADPVCRGVAEVSIYVAEAARGCGIGGKLMSSLVTDSEAKVTGRYRLVLSAKTRRASNYTPSGI